MNATTHPDTIPGAHNRVLAVVLTSYPMIVLDISIVITGLPDIQKGLGFSPVSLSWVQNAYLLCFGGFLLLAARGPETCWGASACCSPAWGCSRARRGPLTVAGMAGVADHDQGAASGVVNVFRQLGGSLGLGLLVVVFASSNAQGLAGVPLLSHRIAMALTGAGVMLTLSLMAALLLVLPAERAALAR